MFLSCHPNWQGSPGPADSPEACGERRMFCHQPKPSFGCSGVPMGPDESILWVLPGQFHGALKKTNREGSVQWRGGPELLVASSPHQPPPSPHPNPTSTGRRALHGTGTLGNQGPIEELKTGFLLQGWVRFPPCCHPSHFPLMSPQANNWWKRDLKGKKGLYRRTVGWRQKAAWTHYDQGDLRVPWQVELWASLFLQ